jgi:hypothetical protein
LSGIRYTYCPESGSGGITLTFRAILGREPTSLRRHIDEPATA